MNDLWQNLPGLLPPIGQQIGLLCLLLAPVVILGVVTTKGFAPWPLVRAMLWRFRWANAIFISLIAISVGIGIGLLAQERGLRTGSAKAAEKFELVITAPGSDVTMMLATVFLQPTTAPLLNATAFDKVINHPKVRMAAPLAFGDSFDGAPIVGTTAELIQHLSGGNLEGRLFANLEEAVIGSAVALEIGAEFEPIHGRQAHSDSGHGFHITVVGRMQPTGSPWDQALLVPIESVWDTHGLARGHGPDESHLGVPFDPNFFPGTSAIIVTTDSPTSSFQVFSRFSRDPSTLAFFPGAVLSKLYRVMGDTRAVLSIIAVLTQGLVTMAVLLGLFILTRLFARHLGLLRAIGAPNRFVFAVVWAYATTLLALGAVIGLGLGVAASHIIGQIVADQVNIQVPTHLGWTDVKLAAGFLSLSSVASILPAALTLRRSVLDALRA